MHHSSVARLWKFSHVIQEMNGQILQTGSHKYKRVIKCARFETFICFILNTNVVK